MSALDTIGRTIAIGAIAQPEDAVRAFLEYFDSRGIDRSHPFFRDFRPDDRASLAALKARLAGAAGEEKAARVIVKYMEDYLNAVPVRWASAADYLRIAAAFLAEPEGSMLWNTGKFIEQKTLDFIEKNRATCPEDTYACDDLYTALKRQGKISVHQTLAEKFLPRLKERGVGYTLSAIWRNAKEEVAAKLLGTGAAGVGSRFRSGALSLREIGGALRGFKLLNVVLAGQRMGMLVIGDPREGARAGIRVMVGGAVTESGLERDFAGRLQLQATLTMQSTEGVPLGTVVVNGRTHQLRFEAGRQDGLIMAFPDGTLRIVDKRRFRLADVTGKDADASVSISITSGQGHAPSHFLTAVRTRRATILSAASYDPSGEFEQWNPVNGDSNIRLLFTFKDGKFGIFDTARHSTNEMLAVLYRLEETFGPLERVVRCDRGMWDSAAYYKNGKTKVPLGTVNDDPSNRIYFYTEGK